MDSERQSLLAQRRALADLAFSLEREKFKEPTVTNPATCPICKSEAKLLDKTGDATGYDCPEHKLTLYAF